MSALFRRLLVVLPKEFRAEFGEEIVATVEARWREVGKTLGALGAARFWLRQVVAVIRVGFELRLGRSDGQGGSGSFPVPPRSPRGRRGPGDGLLQDLRVSLRGLLARPGFTLASVVTLALGIGAATSIYGTAHAVLFRPLPYQDADRVVTLVRTGLVSGDPEDGMSAADVHDLDERSRLLERVAVAEPWSLDLVEEGRAYSLRTWTVSEGFFEAIGGQAEHGRTFTTEEYREGAAATVVLSHWLWESRFGGDASVVGRTVILDSAPHLVVGVMPASFKFPDAAAAWSPRPPQDWDADARDNAFMTGLARMAPGVTLEQAQAEADRLSAELAATYPETNAEIGFVLVPLREHLFGDVRLPLLTLLGAVVFVFLIACANVAGLHLARGWGRQSEFALRGALGATRARLFSLTLLEAALLSVAGGVLGLGLAVFGVRLVAAIAPEVPRIDELGVDASVYACAAVAALVCTLLSGVAPSLTLSRTNLQAAMGEVGRSATHGLRGTRLRRQLVVGEVALAIVLLIGAGLLFRSFTRLLENPLGFEPDGRLAAQVFVYGQSDAELESFLADSREAIEALPGVRGVALTSSVPLASDASIASIDQAVRADVVGLEPIPDADVTAWLTRITPEYPEVMGIDVVAGRPFTGLDDARSAPVVIVNETFARRRFADGDAVGEQLLLSSTGSTATPSPREIVGVVRDVRPLGFESEPRPEVFAPLAQLSGRSLTYVVHADVDPASLTLPVQEAIWSVNPYEAVWAAEPMTALLGELTGERRFNLVLLATFAGIALVLTATGLYGLIAYSVEERLVELGVRRALGGRTTDIVRMVVREAALLAGLGILIGIAVAALLTRVMRGMLYEIDPFDPLTFAVLSAVVMGVALLATVLPLRRAVRADPLMALRSS